MVPNARQCGLSCRCGSDHSATEEPRWWGRDWAGRGGAALETWLSSVCEEFRLGPKIIGTRAADTDGVLYTHKLLAKPCTLWGGNWDTAQRVAAS